MANDLYLIGYGILLGLGAAMPLGPVNLEMIRRNLSFGTRSGLFLGFGASCTDLTYITILSLGALTILTHPIIMLLIGTIGALILGWFGIDAINMVFKKNEHTKDVLNVKKDKHPLRHLFDGYLMTLINPMTILFWISVSSQVALVSHHRTFAMFFTALGVIVGAAGWAISLNTVLHFTRHKVGDKTMRIINCIGGLILFGFALFGLIHSLLLYIHNGAS